MPIRNDDIASPLTCECPTRLDVSPVGECMTCRRLVVTPELVEHLRRRQERLEAAGRG